MQLHNHEQKVNTKQLFKINYLNPYFRNIVNTLNYSNATNLKNALSNYSLLRWKALISRVLGEWLGLGL